MRRLTSGSGGTLAWLETRSTRSVLSPHQSRICTSRPHPRQVSLRVLMKWGDRQHDVGKYAPMRVRACTVDQVELVSMTKR